MTIDTKINKIKSSADRIITKSAVNYYRINSWNYTLIHNKATFINIHILLRVKKEILKNKEYIHKKVDRFIRENRKILLLFKNEKISSFRIKFINIVDLFASEVVQIPVEQISLSTKKQSAKKQSAKKQSAKKQSAKKQSAKKRSAKKQSAKKQSAKKSAKKPNKKRNYESEAMHLSIEAGLSEKQLNILMDLFDGPKKTATLAKTYKLGNSKKAYVFLKDLEKRKWIYRYKPEGQRTVEWTLKNKSDKYSFSEWFVKYIETKKPEYFR